MSYPIIAISVSRAYPWGWLALRRRRLMYWILVHVSGIPPLEEHMLRSRGSVFAPTAGGRVLFSVAFDRLNTAK